MNAGSIQIFNYYYYALGKCPSSTRHLSFTDVNLTTDTKLVGMACRISSACTRTATRVVEQSSI